MRRLCAALAAGVVAMAVARRSHLDRLCEGPINSGVDVEDAEVEPYTQRGQAGERCRRQVSVVRNCTIGNRNRRAVRVVRLRESELEACLRGGGDRHLAEGFADASVAPRAPRRVLGFVGQDEVLWQAEGVARPKGRARRQTARGVGVVTGVTAVEREE